MSNYITWEEAQKQARKAPARGYMGPASAIEIALPDISGSIAEIYRFKPVPYRLKAAYHEARSKAFAYGGGERRKLAEMLLDEVHDSLRAYNMHTSLLRRKATYGHV